MAHVFHTRAIDIHECALNLSHKQRRNKSTKKLECCTLSLYDSGVFNAIIINSIESQTMKHNFYFS